MRRARDASATSDVLAKSRRAVYTPVRLVPMRYAPWMEATMPLTQRMQAVQTPIIPKVGKLIRDHPGTISLGQGVVHYGPPPQAIDRIARFLAEPDNHKYKAVHGIRPLRDRIEAKLEAENGILCASASRIAIICAP